jgi:single-stranded-DNA-specific exonuclease
MIKEVKKFSEEFLEKLKGNKIHVVSHFDTDGISSASIFSKTLERLGGQFSLKVVKQLTEEEIKKFPKDRLIILLDLGSGSLKELSLLPNQIIIIDHHEIKKIHSKNLSILNPHFFKEYEDLCTAELTYLVSKAISEENKDLAYLAILGMVGDTMEKEINKTRNQIIKEAGVIVKKGLLIYPSTRPIDRALEYSSNPFIPGVTGDPKGVFELLKEAGIEKINNKYKSLIDLSEEEMKNLVTAITLRLPKKERYSEYLGNLYLIKLFNKIEDAREISAIINACSRMDQPEMALLLCLGNNQARKNAERVYCRYRQHIISGLKYIEKNGNIHGEHYVIINAKDQIKDTIIGTLASILSFSSLYKEGTIIVAMAYNEDNIKVSLRMVGKNKNRNLKEVVESVAYALGGVAGGHKNAAGCIIKKEDEDKFIELVKKKLEFDLVKI